MALSSIEDPRRHVIAYAERVGHVCIQSPPQFSYLTHTFWPDLKYRLSWILSQRRPLMEPGLVFESTSCLSWYTILRFTVFRTIQNLIVKVQRLSARSCEFDIVGVDASIANALRRILIAEVSVFL